MFFKNKKPSETRPLLEEHIETGQERQERQRNSKYLYFEYLNVVLFSPIMKYIMKSKNCKTKYLMVIKHLS